MSRRVLITGGAGFIGSHLVRRFAGQAEVTVLDDLRSGYARNLEGVTCRFVRGSILDPGALAEAASGAAEVYHLAAMVSVPESVAKPTECAELNTEGTRRVLDAALAVGARKVVLASSAAIYGDNPTVPKLESMPPEPKSPYAETKLAGERLLEEYRRAHGLGTASLRFFNVFGPRQDPRSAYAAAVPIFIAKALRDEPIGIHGDGGQTRDFVHVTDIVGALAYAGASAGMTGTYNVGYGRSQSILALAQEIVALTGSRSKIEHLPPRAGDVRHSLASTERLLAAGWQPRSSVSAGLAETIAYFRALTA
ncbi:MAG: NAD-dependent epimerase/dehydratase family protein [Verrucomicrobia bacterium]|nr:NAD-dependent epimerase/dehydratase family protein [Verrucomicrobiota bacterium]